MEKDNGYSLYEIAQMCEIALILSNVETDADGLEEQFENHIRPIFEEWKNGLDKGIFKNEEEEGYISAYAERIADERYPQLVKR